MNDVWGGNYGYQILFFSDTTAYGKWFTHGNVFPENTFPASGLTAEEVYAKASFTLPSDAKPDINSNTAVYNNQTISVSIPEGYYDMVIVNLTENFGDPVFLIPESPDGYQDNIHLFDGSEYHFEISYEPGSTPRGDKVVFTPAHDLQATQILLPASGPELGTDNEISMKVTNTGKETVSDFSLTYSIDGGEKHTEKVSHVLASGESYTHTFSQKADFSQSGHLYTVVASVQMEKDAQIRNNLTTDYVKNHGTSTGTFTETFDQEETLLLNWSIVDANQDDSTWTFFPGKDFEDNPRSGCIRASNHEKNPGDDYLVTKDPIFLEKGKANISFYSAAQSKYISENLEILIGNSANPEEMQTLENFTIESNLFEFYSVETEIATEGAYYVAFKYASPKNQLYLYLDQISISNGSFERQPDLSMKHIILPVLPCLYTEETLIGAIVENLGNQDIYGFELSLYGPDGLLGTETFSDTIFCQTSREIYFQQKFDLLSDQKSVISVKGNLTDKNNPDTNPDNDSISSYTYPQASINELPYQSDFSSMPWRSLYDLGWILEDNIHKATEDDIPLFSPCISLQNGQRYRFQMEFTAGMIVSGYDFPDNFLVLFGKKETDWKEWDTLMYCQDIVELELSMREKDFYVDETGEYGIAIMSTFFYSLHIHNVRITQVGDVDARLNQAVWMAAHTLPESQMVKGSKLPLGVSVENRGMQICQTKVILKDEKGNTWNIGEFPVKDGSVKDTLLSFELKQDLKEGTHRLMVEIETEGDESLIDNMDTLTFNVSKDYYAMENMNDFSDDSYIIGAGVPAIFGMIYEIYQPDTLTAIRLGLGSVSQNMDIGICLYKMNSGISLGEKIFNIQMERGTQAGLKDFTFAPVILKPGRYFVGAQQLGDSPINIGADMSDEGKIFIMESNFLYEQSDLGYPCIRPVFTPSSTLRQHDIAALGITSPITDSAFFSTKEKVSAIFFNNGSDTARNVDIVFLIDKMEKQVQTIDMLPPYTQREISFEADMSKSGDHIITIYSLYQADTDPSNDTLRAVFRGRTDFSDPYVMDFEFCNDFAIGNFRPTWKNIDLDNSHPGSYLEGISFPNDDQPSAFMAFNPSQTSPSVISILPPYKGQRYGVSFFAGSQPNNDWLISPKLKMDDQNPTVRFVVRAVSNDVITYTEVFNVLVSEKSDNPEDFVPVRMNIAVKGGEWQPMEISLKDYAGKEIHVAIQCISYNQFMFMIDDIRITKPGEGSANEEQETDPFRIYPVPASELVHIEALAGQEIKSCLLYDMSGREILRKTYPGHQFSLDVRHLHSGIYLLRMETENGWTTRKLVIH